MYRIVTLILFGCGFLSVLCAQTANWSAYKPELFPTNASGQIHGISRVSQMKFHPTNSSKLYAVSARGGLFISSDGGNNWSLAPGCDNMPFSALASVCIDFTNDQILYLGAGDHNYYYSWGGSTGVWKSTNGGQTFTQTSLNNKIIVEMVMDPNNNNIIVAATNGGIYKTTNAGSTWSLKTASRAFDDMKQKTPTSRVLYAATRDSAFFRSLDFGDTWSQINTGIVLPPGVTDGDGCRIAVTPADTNIVYLGMVANAGIIYKSTNGGTSFTGIKTAISPYLTYYNDVSTSSSQGDYNFGIGVDRVNANILYLVAHNVWKSTDGGVNWTQLTNWWAEVHTDMHQIVTSPYNNNQLWNMNDGGVWLSMDGGQNWNPKSDGLYGYEIYHGNCSPTRRDMMSIGTQDNGELYSTSAGWFTNRGGDWGSKCAFDYRSNSSTVYYFENNKRRSVSGSDGTYGLPASVTSLQDIAFHRSNSNLAFVADTSIFRTTNLLAGTPAWTELINLNKKIMAMHCSFADANRLYVITSDANIYVSTNALSASPTFTSYALPNSSNSTASITSITSSPNTVYITCNTKVYKSTDNGATWTNITYNLPSVNHVRVIADEYFSSNETVLLATNNAVYYKIASANAWSIYNLNLPARTNIVDMSIFNDGTSNTILRVATYGRGMWETSITNLRDVNANFAANDTNPCPGGVVNFSDLSTGAVTTRSWSFPGGNPSTSTAVNPSVTYPTSGVYNVTLTVSDGVSTSSMTKNNYINIQAGNLPLVEGFEDIPDPPAGWKNNNNGNSGYVWVKTSDAGGFSASANSMMFNNYSWNSGGDKDEIETPRVDFTGYNSITLTFDVAYQVYPGYADSLNVLISTDCGQSFTTVYSKGGSVLSTAGSASSSFIPTAAQWRTETINLNSYSGQGNVILRFQNVNYYGNKLYIDNINVNATVEANAGTDKSICSGNSVSIGMNPVSGISYSWSPTSGLSSSGISNPVANPINTTTYILTAVQPTSGIINKDTVVVVVSPSIVTSVSITANPAGGICQGTNVTFTANAVNAGSPVYQWKKNGINVGSSSATYVSNSFVSSDQIVCVVTGNAACSSGSPATSNTITMTVTQSVTPSITISASPSNSICQGNSVTFTATPVHGGTPPSYQWKKNGVTVGTNSPTYTDNALLNGTQIYCILNSNASCATTTSATSNIITMTVSSNVSAGVSISANPSGTICQGTNVIFTATPSNGGTTPAYTWKKNGIQVGSNSPTYADNSLNTSDAITCEMTSSGSCVSGNPAMSNTLLMNVDSSVPASVSIVVSPTGAVCQGELVTFTATPVNGGSPVFQWKKNGVNVGSNSSIYSSNSLAQADVIVCEMTSNAYCVTGSPANSNSISMVVNPVVVSGVTIAASPGGAICSNTNVTFTATPVNGGSPAYQWKKNGINVGTNSPNYTNNSFQQSDQITCIMTSSLTCVSGSPANSNTLTMSVTPSVTPSISIVANPSGPICQGTSVTYTATALNGGTPVYRWKKNGVDVGTNSPTYTTNTLVNGNQIYCVLNSNASCASPISATSNILVASVSSYVTAGVTISANPSGPVCQGSNVTFTASPVNGGSAVYQWKINNMNTGSNSSSFSTNALADGDVVNCIMTSGLNCVNGSPATSNSLTESVLDTPSVTGFLPSSGNSGDNILISGNGFTNVTHVAFNGTPASFTVNSTVEISATVPAGATTGKLAVQTACGTSLSSGNFQVLNGTTVVALRILIEGLYLGGGIMTNSLGGSNADSVTLELHESFPPYNMVAASKEIVNISGNGNFYFPVALSGSSYYLVVKHRNALETWSAEPLFLSGNTSYDFSTGSTKAFGGNMKNMTDGNWALYSGDISDANLGAGSQDGVIESQDYSDLESAVSVTLLGYVPEDITGDFVVESSDYSILEGNVYYTIAVIRP